MQSVVIQTLTEFTDLIERTCTDQEDVLFRGQSADWPLLPSLARERLTEDVLIAEQSMLDDFQRHSVPYLRTVPTTTWEWLALAQHYGLPTRLLDWSQNPLTSLWFAVCNPARQPQNGVVWILRPTNEDYATASEKNSLECKRNSVFAPKDMSERITSQVAWFTVHKCSSGDSHFEPLEQSSEFGGKLTKVLIPASRFAHLRFYLNTYGVNHASVFPGLDGLCAHLKWQNCFLSDEGEPQA